MVLYFVDSGLPAFAHHLEKQVMVDEAVVYFSISFGSGIDQSAG
jgi:hypothetical protein